MKLDGDGGGPLYELSPLLAHLPVRYVDLKYSTLIFLLAAFMRVTESKLLLAF
jgi:hypothetical protein